jgi:uncharacterized membrane protein
VSLSATTFLAVVLPSSDEAEAGLAAVHALKDNDHVSVQDAAVVSRTHGGRVELQQTREFAPGEAIVAGGTAGLVAGLLLSLPIGGALLGLAGRMALGFRDTGIPDGRLRELGVSLESGQALLCVLVDPSGVVPTRQALGRYGTVFEVELADSEP